LRQSLGVRLSRAYHGFIAFLEGQLASCGLDRDLRPGMGHVLFQLLDEDGLSLKDPSAG
jgi:hypothetical protein